VNRLIKGGLIAAILLAVSVASASALSINAPSEGPGPWWSTVAMQSDSVTATCTDANNVEAYFVKDPGSTDAKEVRVKRQGVLGCYGAEFEAIVSTTGGPVSGVSDRWTNTNLDVVIDIPDTDIQSIDGLAITIIGEVD
jgi:hypothetical protein